MKSRSTICFFLSLIILVAHARCVVSHAAELTRVVQSMKHEIPSSDDGRPCEDDSACLCKGALVNELTVTSLDQTDLLQWMSWANQASSPSFFSALNTCHYCNQFTEPTAIVGGVTARALLQSFQI